MLRCDACGKVGPDGLECPNCGKQSTATTIDDELRGDDGVGGRVREERSAALGMTRADANSPADAAEAGIVARVCPAGSVRPVRDDPGLVGDDDLRAFRDWLVDDANDQRVAEATALRIWSSALRPIFRRLGPRESGNPRGLGLIDRIPAFPKPGRRARASRGARSIVCPPASDAGRFYTACEVARWPRDAWKLWRVLVVLLYTYGLRTGDLVALRWDAVTFDEASPLEESTTRNPHGWLRFVTQKTARLVVVPLTPIARAHLERINGPQDGAPLFPAFGDRAGRLFYREWKRIAEAAGRPTIRPRHFRKTANTIWNTLEGHKPLGRYVLGHARQGINETHYFGVDEQLVAAAAVLPSPPEFAAIRSAERQLRLFERGQR